MSEATHLLWVDLETTGTAERLDPILEVGWILTPAAAPWDTLDEGEITLALTDQADERLRENDYVRQMHEASGLLADCARSGSTGSDAQAFLIRVLRSHRVAKRRVMLAGSGVSHFDRRFLKTQLSDLERYLAYPNLDVGVLRRFVQMTRPDLVPEMNAEKPHRGLADVRLHRDEARHYAQVLARTATA